MPPKKKPAPKKKSGGKRARSSELSSTSSDSDDILSKLVNKLERDENDAESSSSSTDATFKGDDDSQKDDGSSSSDDGDEDDESVVSSDGGDHDSVACPHTADASSALTAVKGGKNKTSHSTTQHQHPAQEIFTMRSVAAAGSIVPSVGLLATENASIALSVATARESLHPTNNNPTSNHGFSMRMLAGNNTLDAKIPAASPSSLHQYFNAAVVEGSTFGGWGVSTMGALGAQTSLNMSALGGFTAYQGGEREGPTSSLVLGVGYGQLGIPIPGTAISSNQLGTLNMSLRQTQHANNTKEAGENDIVSSSSTGVVNVVGPALPFTVSGSRLDSSALRSHHQKQAHILDVLEGKQSIRNLSLKQQSADSATSSLSTTLDHGRVQDASYLVPQSTSSQDCHDSEQLQNKLMMDSQIFPLSLLSNGAMFDVFTSTLESTLNSLVSSAQPSGNGDATNESEADGRDGDIKQQQQQQQHTSDCHTILNDTLVSTLNEITRQQVSLREKGAAARPPLPSSSYHPCSEPFSPFAKALMEVVLASASTDDLTGGSLVSKGASDALVEGSGQHQQGGGNGNGRGGADGGITSYASVRKHRGGGALASEHEDELFSFFDSDGEGDDNPSKNKLASQGSAAQRRHAKNVELAYNSSSQQLVELPRQRHMRSFLDRAEFLRAAEEAEFRHALFIEQRNRDAEMRALRRRNNGE